MMNLLPPDDSQRELQHLDRVLEQFEAFCTGILPNL
jgi:hypothetical protein